MKRFLQILICVLLSITTICCVACNKISTKTTTNNGSESEETTTTDEDASDENTTDEDATHYTVTFVTDANVSVYVYNTQDMSGSGTQATSAVARDGSTGKVLVDGNGQVNFKLVFEDGYMLNSITADKNYKNIKDPSDTTYTNGYRITKITGDVTVTIASMEEVDGFTATFNYDTSIDGLAILVYDTQDYSGTYTTYSSDTTIYAKTDEGVITTDAGEKPQVNFKVVLPEGYAVDTITVTEGMYGNIKLPADTGADDTYRVTKVTGNIEITITVKRVATETGFLISIDDAEYTDSASLSIMYGADWQKEITAYATYSDDTKTEIDVEFSEEPTDAGIYEISVSYESYSPITLNLTIEKKEVTIPTNSFDTLLYTGEELEFFPENYDEYYMSISGNTATNKGEYTAIVALSDTDNLVWSDGTSESKEYTWYIDSTITFNEPTANTNVFTYNGEDQTYIPNGFNSTYMTISNNVQKEVGSYTVTVSLKDTINYSWVGGGNEDKTYTFIIEKTLLNKPTASSTKYSYTGSALTYIPAGFDEETMTISQNVQTNVGIYTAIVSLIDTENYEWADSTTDDVNISWSIVKATLSKPTAPAEALTYTGSLVTFTPTGYNANTMTISGNTATNTGTYTAIIGIKDTANYMWWDESNADISIEWAIAE